MVEDLHWIDPNSEEMLRSLGDALPERCVLLPCTCRTGYMPAWHEHACHRRLELDPLSAADSAKLTSA